MDSLDEMTKNKGSLSNFFNHVFNFDDNSKESLLNSIQYALTAVIPIVLLNKCMQKYIPEADDEKGNVELIAEIVVQIITMFIGMFFINRFITFFPTYSGAKYTDFHVTTIILPLLMIILSLQTKLGDKVSILYERACELWEGEKKPTKSQQKTQTQQAAPPAQSPLQNTTSISQLPPIQSSPDFNAMYQQNNTPLVDAATPMDDLGPAPANSGGGGSAFSSAFGGGW